MGRTCYGGGEPAMGKNPQIPSHKHVTETKHCKEIFSVTVPLLTFSTQRKASVALNLPGNILVFFLLFLMTCYGVEQSAAAKSQFFCPSTVYLWPESMLWDTGQLVPWRDTENSGGVPPVQWACSVQGILWHHGEWLVIKTSLNCTSYYKLRFSQSTLLLLGHRPSTTARQRSLFWAILFNWLHEWPVFLMSTSR